MRWLDYITDSVDKSEQTPGDSREQGSLASCSPCWCPLAHHICFCDPMEPTRLPLSMLLSRWESWSGLPFPSPGDLPSPGTELGSPALQAGSVPAEPPGLHGRHGVSKGQT